MDNSENNGQSSKNSVDKNIKPTQSLTQIDKPVDVFKKPNEIDYKKSNFDFLISNVESKVLQKCFSKILMFLDNSSLEMEFRNVSKILDEILVRIVKDVNVLITENMYGKCKVMCNNIVKKVNMYNTKIYILSCSHKQEAQNALYAGIGGNSKNILVYKKIYYSDPSDMRSPMNSRPDSALSHSSSFDTEDYSWSSVGTSEPLTESFKRHSLNLMLKFVKDKKQNTLAFSGLSEEKACFVNSMFSSVIGNLDGGNAVKKICPALWEAFKIFGLKYEFSIRLTENFIDAKSLLLEKVERDNQKTRAEVFDVDKEFATPITKQMLKQRHLVRCIPSDFVISALKSFLKFYEDETEASLIFPIVNCQKANFLRNILNYCRSSKIKSLYEEEAQQIFDEIQVLNETITNIKIKMKEKKLGLGQTAIHYTKVPHYDKFERQTEKPTRQWYPPLGTTKDQSNNESSSRGKNVDKILESITKQKASTSNSGRQYGSTSTNINFHPGNMNSIRRDGVNIEVDTQFFPKASVLRESMNASKNHINRASQIFKSPQSSAASSKAKLKKTLKSSTWKNIPKRTNQQLVEALSVPVKSDKAIKMMLSMGWTGGALGSRGDGITEPIMPHLSTVAGAGFGHSRRVSLPIPNVTSSCQKKESTVKELKKDVVVSENVLQECTSSSCVKKCTPRTRTTIPEFQILFLTELLELLNSTDDTKTIVLDRILKKKAKAFMLYAMKFLSTRTHLKLLDTEQQELVDSIAIKFRRDPDLLVFARIANSKKEIVLKKVYSGMNRFDRTKYPPQLSDNMSLEESIQFIIEGYGTVCQTEKEYANTRYRVELLLNLLKFIKNNEEMEMEIDFGREITKKEKRHFVNSIGSINKKMAFGANSPEVAVSHLIKINMRNFKLNYTSHKINLIRVNKEYLNESTNPTETAITDVTSEHDDIYEKSDDEMSENMDTYNENYEELNKSNNKYTVHQFTDVEDESPKENEFSIRRVNVNSSMSYSDNATPNCNNAIENEHEDDNEIVEYLCIYEDVITELNKTRRRTRNNRQKYLATDFNHDNKENKKLIQEKTETEINNEETFKVVRSDNKTNQMTSKLSTAETTIESKGLTDNTNDLGSDIPLDKMSISDQSQCDNNALEIDDVSMSEGKLTDWDPKTSDISDESDNLDSNLNLILKTTKADANLKEINKKQSKSQINKSKNDVELVSLTKSFVLAEDLRKYIQDIMSFNILQSKELPLLKCYGIQNGTLIYSCHDKNSHDWLSNICVTNGVTMTSVEYDKMSFKINCFQDSDDYKVFNMLELYNKDISTRDWSILKRQLLDDCVLFIVKMDEHSFKYILDSDLALYAGVDKIYFSIIWE